MNQSANPTMLLAVSMQLETLLKAAPEMPEYLKNSATQFVDDLKKYAAELEAAKKKIVTV